MEKNNSGITLIALVITIIVLLILAGVSINLVVGQNGILNNAQTAVTKNQIADAEETVKMAWTSCEILYQSAWAINQSTLRSEYYTKQNLEKNISAGEITAFTFDETNGGVVKYTKNGNEFEFAIDIEGNVTMTLRGQVKPSNYGDYVNYPVVLNCNSNLGEINKENEIPKSDWRILYSDENGVFLIAADYVRSDSTLLKNGTSHNEMEKSVDSNYSLSWPGTITSQDVTYADLFSPVIANETVKWEGNYSTYKNCRATSTLLNVQNWNNFVNTNYADYAIGGPTMNMIFSSMNQKYPKSNKYYSNNVGEMGFYIGTSSAPTGTSISGAGVRSTERFKDTLYWSHWENSASQTLWNGVRAYWVATPLTGSEFNLGCIRCNGNIGECDVRTASIGIRPVVHLKLNAAAEKDANGVWQLSN